MENIRGVSLDLKIGHRNWEEALALAFALLISVSPGEVVCITGPSRAGKTRLIRELVRLLVGEDRFEQTGLLPAVVIEAVNDDNDGGFSTKSFTERMLDAIRHPLLSMVGHTGIELDFAVPKMDLKTEVSMRKALEKGMRARKVRYLFIDEAQHARYVSRDAMGAFAVMDSWKCLAQVTGIVLVVVGAYPILEIVGNSPHLIGRKHQVHLPRYQYTGDDLREFAIIIREYEKRLHICESMKGLLSHLEFLYQGSVGCIGLLRGWLLRAAALAQVKGVPIDRKLLTATRMSDDDLRKTSAEILEGERLLSSSEQQSPPEHKEPAPSIRAQRQSKPFQKKPVRRRPGHRTEERS